MSDNGFELYPEPAPALCGNFHYSLVRFSGERSNLWTVYRFPIQKSLNRVGTSDRRNVLKPLPIFAFKHGDSAFQNVLNPLNSMFPETGTVVTVRVPDSGICPITRWLFAKSKPMNIRVLESAMRLTS
jgi:hypothetical protein